MRIFVASWFFPPATSSEGIVTYKLLRNSKHTYDVCCGTSKKWGYKHDMDFVADNITVFPREAKNFDKWNDAAFQVFMEEHAKNPYDAFMTRTMPAEAIDLGARIKDAVPDLPWISSLADPVATSPYLLHDLVIDSDKFEEEEKPGILNAINGWSDSKIPDVEVTRFLLKQRRLENLAVGRADMLVFPCGTLMSHVLKIRPHRRAIVVPHSYDDDLYPEVELESSDDGKITFTFLGHTDLYRSLKPVVEAIHNIQMNSPELLDKIRIRCIGNISHDVRDLIYNWYLHDIFEIEQSVDYETSLGLMKQADWLIHVDAFFEEHADTGGSLFFAGKIADYFGTDTPILALTGKGSPAHKMIKRDGGVCVDPRDSLELSDVLEAILRGELTASINREYRDQFAAPVVAAGFDEEVEKLVNPKFEMKRTKWPELREEPWEDKFLSICIPAYNVECYLDRCLISLMRCDCAPALDIIVVNDGSKDYSLNIAREYEKRYPGVIQVIDKKNGGHGSTINAALKVARGKYFRVLDGDDWFDGKSFDATIHELVERGLEPDIISSNYRQVNMSTGKTVQWDKQGSAEFYEVHDFDVCDFTMEYFTMAAVSFRTEILRQANFDLQEHTFYVDVEYLLYPIPYAHSVVFTPEYVYRYAVGGSGQSINPKTFVDRYDHHDRVIRRMLSYYEEHRPHMSVGQDSYMRSLFRRHLLRSHYLLSVVWDDDRERGLARAKDFDEFLKASDEELWQYCGKQYAAVAKVRRRHFTPTKKPIKDLGETPPGQSNNRLYHRIRSTPAVEKLAENKKLKSAFRSVFRKDWVDEEEDEKEPEE